VSDIRDADRDDLHALGYAQELHRGMGWFSNFAISFSIISILAGGMTSYWLGMVTGGPIVITFGWIIVGFFALLVGMSMGEICSAYPTAGGLYFWSAKLARKNGARWSWYTGWFNLLGQIGVIASVDYALAIFIGYFIRMFDDGFKLTAWTIFGIYILVLISHGLLNTFGVKLVRILGDVSVWWHVGGVAIIFAILMIAPTNNRVERSSRSTCSRSGFCWPSTRSPASTPPPTSARRRKVRGPRHRRRSCGRSTYQPSPRSS
jgi:amino acid transporter